MDKAFKATNKWLSILILVCALVISLIISQSAYASRHKFSSDTTSSISFDSYTIPVVLKPEQHAILSSMMEGHIENLPVKEGAQVKQGQLLVEFNCKIQHAQYDKASAQLSEAKVSHDANMRLKYLGAISEPELESSKLALAEANSNVTVSKELTDYCKVTSPFAGAIVNINIKQYQSIARNTELLEILDNSKLRLELIAPSNWLSWLTNGYKFKVNIAELNKTYPAIVTSILPKIDAISQTVRIIAKIEGNPSGLIAGMNGKANFK